MSKIAVIGKRDSVLALKAVGIEVFDATSVVVARETLKHLAKNGYAIILVTESIAKEIKETIDRFRPQTYPVIIPIPDANGSTGYSLERLKNDMEKAIGADILFKNQN